VYGDIFQVGVTDWAAMVVRTFNPTPPVHPAACEVEVAQQRVIAQEIYRRGIVNEMVLNTNHAFAILHSGR